MTEFRRTTTSGRLSALQSPRLRAAAAARWATEQQALGRLQVVSAVRHSADAHEFIQRRLCGVPSTMCQTHHEPGGGRFWSRANLLSFVDGQFWLVK